MRTFLILFLVLGFVAPCLGETLPLTIWQKESRWQPVQGEVVKLNRGPFTLVMPLDKGEHLALVAAEGPTPDELTAFEPGHGMAGPYDGLFLTWDASHFFHVDDELPRAELWNRKQKSYFWEADRLYRNYGLGPAEEISWNAVSDLTVIVRKDGYEDLTFHIHWVDY